MGDIRVQSAADNNYDQDESKRRLMSDLVEMGQTRPGPGRVGS